MGHGPVHTSHVLDGGGWRRYDGPDDILGKPGDAATLPQHEDLEDGQIVSSMVVVMEMGTAFSFLVTVMLVVTVILSSQP